jgi:hypothetical protein
LRAVYTSPCVTLVLQAVFTVPTGVKAQGQLLEHDTTVCAISLLLDDELPGHGLWGKSLADTFPGIHHGHIAVHNLSHVSTGKTSTTCQMQCVAKKRNL